MNQITNETLIAMGNKTDRMHKKLIKATRDLPSTKEKIEYIVNHFANNYGYDYSVLNPEGAPKREQIRKRIYYYKKNYECTTVQKILNVNVNNKKINLSPSLHMMKLGTCDTFTAEMEYFLEYFGVKYKKINEVTLCYDRDYPGKKHGKIRPMLHYYLITKFDDVMYKIDIAGAIMAKDFNKNNKNGIRLNTIGMLKTNNPHKSIFAKVFDETQEL